MPEKKMSTILLAVYTLNQHGVYVKQLVTFKSDLGVAVEVPLYLYEKPDGGFDVAIEALHLGSDLPATPDYDEAPRSVTPGVAETLLITGRPFDLVPPPTLPRNPTAEQRWKFLLDVLKRKA